MKLNEMREALAARGIQLTKSLGQNFLHDGNQLRRIIAAAELTKLDRVLEIGPGLGPLTELLLVHAGEVLAIEKDRRLIEFLQKRFGSEFRLQPVGHTRAEPPKGGTPNFQLLHEDALKFLKREQRDWSDWKLVANLPYSVASPILVELAQNPKRPERMVGTLQLEVAQRLMSVADDDDYGVLTLLVQLRYEPRACFKIPSECFFPAPGVDSACVVLERRVAPLLPEAQHAAFEKIVKLAFSQRRKMMLKLLKQDWPMEKLAGTFEEIKISPQARAETVTLDQFVQLTLVLSNLS